MVKIKGWEKDNYRASSEEPEITYNNTNNEDIYLFIESREALEFKQVYNIISKSPHSKWFVIPTNVNTGNFIVYGAPTKKEAIDIAIKYMKKNPEG